jgi:RNA polymerase sigma-70 factor, ECF subfamily
LQQNSRFSHINAATIGERASVEWVRDPGASSDRESVAVALTSADRQLVQRCLNHEPGAWNDFVDRYLGLVYHVIHFTAHLRSVTLRPEDVEDTAAEILIQIVANDYAVFRQFEGRSSLATYLTVIARRICVRQLAERAAAVKTMSLSNGKEPAQPEAAPRVEHGLEVLEEVEALLTRLPRRTRQVVKLFFLEGRKYEEISTELGLPVNTIGPILSRAKQVLRKRMQKRSEGNGTLAKQRTRASARSAGKGA